MAGSKPTAVHFTLIFFVMLSLFLGIFAYMFYSDYQEASTKLTEAQRQNDADKTAIANELQEKQELIDAMGYGFAEVGSPDDPNSTLGAVHQDFSRVAGLISTAPQQQTVRDVLGALAAQAAQRAQVAQQSQTSEQQSQATFQQQTAQQQTEVAQARQDQAASEKDLRDLEQKAQEQIASITQQRDQWQAQYRENLGQLETLKAEFLQAQDDWAKIRQQLNNTIDYQREQIAELENISFERADGEVMLVDNTTRTVWINRGARDYLRPQVTFSVYSKEHRGIARSTADVKGKIEVVRVDQNSAECRILEEDLTRPIAPGDPIYSPLWQSGMVEKIAFVGLIDLDGDGVSDRDLLKEIMDVNHSEIKLQITDEGLRSPPEATLDVDTKFLVKGEIPDPTQFPGLDEKVRQIENMMNELHLLEEEADRYGVDVISLNEFLTWVGYRNQQRVFRPGETKGFNLGSGARSTAVDEVYNDRSSSGSTSELFQNRRGSGVQGTGSSGSQRYGR